MARRESNPSVPETAFSAGRDNDRDGDTLYSKLDWNYVGVRRWSVWIDGYRALYGTTISELDCVLMKNERQYLLQPGIDLRRSGSSGLRKRASVQNKTKIFARLP